MNTNVIETTQLCKYYGSLHALENVNVHVPKGAIYGLVGDNGAGKSTLLKILAGQSFATSGEIRLLGQTSERDLRLARKHIGCLIEDTGCFPNMTVAQTLRYYSIQRGISDKRRADEMLALVGLAEKRRAKCGSLSMGQRQRLGLAIAMLAKHPGRADQRAGPSGYHRSAHASAKSQRGRKHDDRALEPHSR